ncbi:MAG: hypothetical protein ACKVWR_20380, partial [Acidimicrobiales bacterium]
MERVLLLMAADSYRAGDFLRAARALGVEVVVGLEAVPGVDRPLALAPALTLDFADLARGLAAVLALHREAPLAAVVAADGAAQGVAAAAAGALAAPAMAQKQRVEVQYPLGFIFDTVFAEIKTA